MLASLSVQMVLLQLLVSLCLSPPSSTNAIPPFGGDVTAHAGELSPATIAAVPLALHATPQPPSSPPRRYMLGVSETLNSHRGQLIPSGAFPSLSAAAAMRGPPLFIGSDGAQRFFDRLHGFVEEKPVAHKQHRRAGSDDNDHDDHDFSSASGRITTKAGVQSNNDSAAVPTAADDDADDNDAQHDYNAQQLSAASISVPAGTMKNWILQKATRTQRQSTPTDTIAILGAEARQSLASLSERIMSQLAAGNPWVNWTQSTGPVVVTSVANLPIGQFPFVVVQPTKPPVTVSAVQQPPKRVWFAFQRPWNNRIYGEGTESKFPPLLERVVQRIQNYWSVFKYEDQSRPYVGQSGHTAMDTTESTTPIADETVTAVNEELHALHDIPVTQSSAINGIEIELDTSTLVVETTTDEISTISLQEDEETTTNQILQTNYPTEPTFYNEDRINEIIESSEKESRRNDKIIRVNNIINNV